MRRIALLLLFMTLVGCKSTVGPLASRSRDQKPDPLYNSELQQRWVRERFPYNEENVNVAPRLYDGPGGR
ncbi:MAG: hypothetical protein K8T89_01945 [Planctomycetes bacterium]|nr:hypothetical protein [Planctomycetota bacterium]